VAQSAIASPAPIEQSPADDRPVFPLAVVLLALGALWFVVCRHLSAEWSYNEQYNYGWFVPFFALYLFWLRWEDRPEPEIRNPKSEIRNRGLAALAIGIPLLLLLLPLRLIEGANPDWRPISWVHAIAVVLLTLLLIWYIGGKPWLRHFAFPVMFVLVAVPWISPIEDPIVQKLMPIVASIATETLSLFGIPAEVQGNLIRINDGMVGVNEACSGVRSLQTSIMIGLLFGELKRLRVGQRILLVAAAVGIAFLANCGRAFFLVWIAATRGVPQVEHWHDIAGYAIVALVFLGCLGVTALLARSAPRGQMAASGSASGAEPTARSEGPTPRREVRGHRSAVRGQPPARRGLRPGGRSAISNQQSAIHNPQSNLESRISNLQTHHSSLARRMAKLYAVTRHCFHRSLVTIHYSLFYLPLPGFS
jgi:exosortase